MFFNEYEISKYEFDAFKAMQLDTWIKKKFTSHG